MGRAAVCGGGCLCVCGPVCFGDSTIFSVLLFGVNVGAGGSISVAVLTMTVSVVV